MPSVKTRERFIRTVWIWLKANRHQSVWEQHAPLTNALNGYYQYFGLRLCGQKLEGVWWRVRKLWRNALLRRSQRAKRRCDWASLDAHAWFQLPKPWVTQPWV
jgi:hypothetical protein